MLLSPGESPESGDLSGRNIHPLAILTLLRLPPAFRVLIISLVVIVVCVGVLVVTLLKMFTKTRNRVKKK